MPARNPSCSGSPSRVRSIRCESLIALVSEYWPVRTASQIRASAPAGTLLRVTNWASHSRRTVSADRHALLLAMTSRRSSERSSALTSSVLPLPLAGEGRS